MRFYAGDVIEPIDLEGLETTLKHGERYVVTESRIHFAILGPSKVYYSRIKLVFRPIINRIVHYFS